MKRFVLGSALVICSLCLVCQPCDAWNRAGHMVSGAMVYSALKRAEGAALDAWTAVLRRHPHYAQRWQTKLEAAEASERDQYLWMLAARWPDDVRGDPAYDKPEWHYINYAFKPSDQPDGVTTVGPAAVNIVTAYRENLETLQSEADEPRKAVALCWLLHLVGDVHQPLHTTKLFTTDFPAPDGDRGGTLFYIRATEQAEPITLHKFWDDLILGSEDMRAVRNASILLRRKYPAGTLPELTPQPAAADFRDWAETESFSLARSEVYRGGQLKGSPQRANAPALPEGYARESKRVAERRLALAAWRLAALIGQMPH